MKVNPNSTSLINDIGSMGGSSRTGKVNNDYQMNQTKSPGGRAGDGARARGNPLEAIKNFFTKSIPNFFKSLLGGGGGGTGAVQQPTVTTPPTRGGGIDLSAYPATDKSSPRRLMEDVLSGTNPALTAAFEKHCEQRLVGDDLQFLREVEAFKANPSLEKAQELYGTYVASSGELSLNFDDFEREAVHNRLDGANQAPGDLFDGVSTTVFNQMVSDQAGKFFSANR